MNEIKDAKSDLQRLRQEIDDLDNQMLRLLNQRMLLVEEIAALKNKSGRGAMDLDREQAIFRRLASQNKGPLAWGAVKKIFGEILAASRDIQSSLVTGESESPSGKKH